MFTLSGFLTQSTVTAKAESSNTVIFPAWLGLMCVMRRSESVSLTVWLQQMWSSADVQKIQYLIHISQALTYPSQYLKMIVQFNYHLSLTTQMQTEDVRPDQTRKWIHPPAVSKQSKTILIKSPPGKCSGSRNVQDHYC